MATTAVAANPEKRMHVFGHLRELRKRLISSLIAFAIFSIAAFLIYDYVVELLIKFYSVLDGFGDENLYVSSIMEGLTTKFKMSLILGLIFSIPVILFNAIAFIFPALKPKTKKYLTLALIASFVLIVVSAYLSYFKILPVSIAFLADGGFIPDDVGLLLNYNTNLFYVLYFVLWSVIAFQTPIIFLLLMAFGIVKRKTALKFSRYIIIAIFVLSAIVTPPDVISQVGIAVPLVAFFFLALLIAKICKFGEE